MKQAILVAAIAVTIIGCSSKTDPSESNFGSAIDAYLAKKGELCLNDETWPAERTDMQEKIDANFGGGNRMKSLASQGLVTSSEVDKPILSFSGKPTGRTQHITRSELTENGKTFFRETKSSYSSPKEGEIRGELCYGKKALADIVKWEGPMKLGDYQEAKVIYQYKINDLADWAKSAEVQSAFPDVKNWVDGAGKKQQTHAVHLTSIGWEANGIDNE